MDKEKFVRLKDAVRTATEATLKDKSSGNPPVRCRPLTAVSLLTAAGGHALLLENEQVAIPDAAGWSKRPFPGIPYRVTAAAANLWDDLASIPESWLPPEDCWPKPEDGPPVFADPEAGNKALRLKDRVLWASALLMTGSPMDFPSSLPFLAVCGVFAGDHGFRPAVGLGNDFIAVWTGKKWEKESLAKHPYRKPTVDEVNEAFAALDSLPAEWIPPEDQWLFRHIPKTMAWDRQREFQERLASLTRTVCGRASKVREEKTEDVPTPAQRKRFEERLAGLAKTVRDANKDCGSPEKDRARKVADGMDDLERRMGIRRPTLIRLLETAGIDPVLLEAVKNSDRNFRRPGTVFLVPRIRANDTKREPTLVLDQEFLAFLDWKDGIPVWKKEEQHGTAPRGSEEDVERIVAGLDTLPLDWMAKEQGG